MLILHTDRMRIFDECKNTGNKCQITWTMYPTEQARKTTTSMRVAKTVDRVIELFLPLRFDELLIPSIALAAAAAVEESISRALIWFFFSLSRVELNGFWALLLTIVAVCRWGIPVRTPLWQSPPQIKTRDPEMAILFRSWIKTEFCQTQILFNASALLLLSLSSFTLRWSHCLALFHWTFTNDMHTTWTNDDCSRWSPAEEGFIALRTLILPNSRLSFQ